MKNSELMRTLALLALGFTSGCERGADGRASAFEHSAAAHQIPPPPPTLPPRPKVPPVAGRPPNMPCWIVVKTALPNGQVNPHATIFRMSYGPSGRLEAASQWEVPLYCLENADLCDDLRGSERLKLKYEYDPTGRLIGATAPRDGGLVAQMSVTYDTAGRVEHFNWIEPLPKGRTNRDETSLAFDSSGRPTATITKGKTFSKKTRDVLSLATFEGSRQPFATTPVLWPDLTEELFFGWDRKVSLGKVEGIGIGDIEETVKYDAAGRIQSGTYSFRGKPQMLRVFAYECPSY